MMKIMKASAGSGKTYNLARTYISILLNSNDRYAYRHILAVTFTNKATDEMKNRILKELHILGTKTSDSDYFNDFVPSIFPDEDTLRERAWSILVDILHDYSAFSVSTIDKFFQMTLKAFSREIGQFASYQVELDKKSLVHESVDRILDSLTEENTMLIDWLNQGVKEQLRQGTRVNLEKQLYSVAERLKSEEQRELSEECGIDVRKVFSSESLSAIRSECSRLMVSFEDEVKEKADAIVAVMNDAGVSLVDTNYHFLAKVTEYAAKKPGTVLCRPTDSFFKYAADKSKWFSKGKAASLLPRVDGLLDGPLTEFCDLFDGPYRAYNTASILKEQVFDLGIAGDLYDEFDKLLKEKNVLSLDDSNSILRGIIDGSDAPFVYEKLGVRFENFLLDEFQDTSTIQWQNFLPLLKESEASGHDNLVVGDVKQSIYRWRGSDWNLLASKLGEQFPSARVDPLDANWRSCTGIVAFNNAFFAEAAKKVGASDLYSDLWQKAMSKDGQEGHVRVTFCPADDEMQAVLESIVEARSSGAGFGDIAVLVRQNSEGGAVANFLRDNGIPIISDDSLSIKSSVTVRRLVSLLSYVENPEDCVSGYLALSLGIIVPDSYLSLPDLCEALLRSLKTVDGGLYARETLYIQSFMDFLHDWCSVNGNSLSGFLKNWKEAKTPCLSSPDDADAVRIITIHKSKGLEFPFVIFPFAEKVCLYRQEWHWCVATGSSSSMLPSVKDAIFPVNLTDRVNDSFFSERLMQEKALQAVDNLNTFYVALTRAEKSLHIVACNPSATYLKSGEAKNFSHILYSFVKDFEGMRTIPSEGEDMEIYEYGQPYDCSRMKKKEIRASVSAFPASFDSYSIDGRLRLSSEASDFFGDDGSVGADASNRLNGIVLHDILASVEFSSDLESAVKSAVGDGRLSEEDGRRNLGILRQRLESVKGMGWFPEKHEEQVRIFNETTVFDSDGSQYRPDRVVVSPSRTSIIDYKSGEPEEKYKYQILKYMRLYRQMGYRNVNGYIWYLSNGTVEKV